MTQNVILPPGHLKMPGYVYSGQGVQSFTNMHLVILVLDKLTKESAWFVFRFHKQPRAAVYLSLHHVCIRYHSTNERCK